MANSLAQDTDLDLLSVAVGGSTVEITPTITSGVKIADYVVDDVPGSLYAPQYSAGTGINITNNTISVTGDITPYSGSEYIDITNHTVSVATPRKLVVDSTLYKSVNTATNELHIGGNYTEGTGIEIDDNIISVTGDIIPYSGGSGISVSNHNISITGNVGSLFEAVYGQTTYSEITAAIADKKIVYCRITPTGASRMAFLAYISNSNVEFQYYRSVGTHTSAQQGDEVYVYTCSSNNTWTTTTRQAYTKIAVGSNLGSAYSNGTLTISANGSANYATSAGSANYATNAGSSNYATSAAAAESAKSAKSAENIIVGGTNYYGWFDIPAYSAANAKFYINTNTANKFSYNLNSKILRVNAISANDISASAFSGNLSGTAFAAESAYQARFADAAILADSAGAAQSAYNIRVYGTDADLYYDIPLYLDVSSELHVDNNNKLLYNPSTNILSATNIIVDNISANSISTSITATSAAYSENSNSALSAGSAEKAASATSALTAGIVDVTQTTNDTWFNVPIYSAGTKKMYVDNDFQLRYNPNSNILSATKISAASSYATVFSGNLSGTSRSALSAGMSDYATNGFFYEGIPGGPTATFNSASTYAIGDYVVTGNTAFSASAAVSTPGAWSSVSSKFTRLSQVVWTITDTKITGLYEGLQIGIKIPSYGGNSGSNATMLNVNGLGNKQIRINDANYTTQYGSGTVATLTYDGSAFQIGDRDQNNYVSQYRTTADAGYFPLLFKKTANSTSETHSARFDERTNYQPSTQTLTVPNVVVSSISATTIYGPTVLTAGKNITITDTVIDCNDAKSNFVYGNNTVNVNTASFIGNFIACQGNSAIAPYFYGNTIFGNRNKMSGGISYSFLAGQYNEIIGNTYNNTIFGANNIISGNDPYYNTIVGTNNSAQDQTSYSFIAGTYNLLSGTNYTNVGVNVLGYDNRVKTFGSYRGSLIAGNGNTVSSNTFGDTSIILGQQNTISGDQIYNMGYYNNISGRHVHSFGERNSASNVEYSMNIGFQLNNTSTSSIQIGFSTAYYIEITPSGIYKILNGVRTSL